MTNCQLPIANEFPPGASEWPNDLSRREFLRLSAATLALAGLGACTKQPIEKIVPYVKETPVVVSGGAPVMEKVVDPKIYFRTAIALLVLLAATWMVAYVDLGPFNLIVALAIAITKAIVIALFFMHIKGSSRLLHLAAVAGAMWLLILISLTLSDYFTRGWVQ